MSAVRVPVARWKIQIRPSELFVVQTQSWRRAASTCMPRVRRPADEERTICGIQRSAFGVEVAIGEPMHGGNVAPVRLAPAILGGVVEAAAGDSPYLPRPGIGRVALISMITSGR